MIIILQEATIRLQEMTVPLQIVTLLVPDPQEQQEADSAHTGSGEPAYLWALLRCLNPSFPMGVVSLPHPLCVPAPRTLK